MNKAIKNLMTIMICILMLACLCMLVACNHNCQHNYSDWVTIKEATCTARGREIRCCFNCDETEVRDSGEILQHDLRWSTNDDISLLTTFCQVCGEETVYDLSDIFGESEGGHAEIVDFYVHDETDVPIIVIKPVADEGYYFLNWKRESQNEISVAHDAILSTNVTTISLWDEEYTPVFTQDGSLIQPITVDIQVENNLGVDIEYLPYVNKAHPTFSYHIHKNDKLALRTNTSILEETDPESLIGGYAICHVEEETGVKLLPHSTGYSYSDFTTETRMIDTVTFDFADIRDKYILTLDEVDIALDEVHKICDKNQVVNVDTTLLGWTGIFKEWQDKDGNVISTQEEFEFVVTETTTLYLIVRTFEVDTVYKDKQFYFTINDDNTLTLHDFVAEQFDDVEIPMEVDGRKVTGLGVLNEQFAGNLIIPDTIVNFARGAFRYLGYGGFATVTFGADRTDLKATDFYGCSENVILNMSETTLRGIVVNELHKLTKSIVGINIIFDENMQEGTSGFYTEGTQTITIQKLTEGTYYTRGIVSVLVHELRHYYQSIAIGSVDGCSVDDLLVVPTDNQLGAWKYLDYTDSAEDYNKYYYNAREIDAREYAEYVLGY